MNLAEIPALAARRYGPYGPMWEFAAWGHTKGSCLVHDGYGVVCLNIPKCASVSMKTLLRPLGFVYRDDGAFTMPSHFRAFAVVRDPVDRYVSAILQYHKTQRADVPLAELADIVLDEMLAFGRPLINDAHAIPQAAFFDERIPITATVAIDRLDGVMTLLRWWGVPVTGPEPRENVGLGRASIEERLTLDHDRILRDFYDMDAAIYEDACENAIVLDPDGC